MARYKFYIVLYCIVFSSADFAIKTMFTWLALLAMPYEVEEHCDYQIRSVYISL